MAKAFIFSYVLQGMYITNSKSAFGVLQYKHSASQTAPVRFVASARKVSTHGSVQTRTLVLGSFDVGVAA